jgi:hypothetical protein
MNQQTERIVELSMAFGGGAAAMEWYYTRSVVGALFSFVAISLVQFATISVLKWAKRRVARSGSLS